MDVMSEERLWHVTAPTRYRTHYLVNLMARSDENDENGAVRPLSRVVRSSR